MSGTPFAVDLSGDRHDRIIWVAFLAGPVLWMTHFLLVYLVAEAGCTGSGPGLELFDSPVPKVLTAVATGVGATATVLVAAWNHRRLRADPQRPDRPDRPADVTGAADVGTGASTGEPVDVTVAAVAVPGPGEPADVTGVAVAGTGASTGEPVDVTVAGTGEPSGGTAQGPLAFAGLLLAGLATVAILFQGLIGLFLPAC